MPPFFNIDDFVIRRDQRTQVPPTVFRILLENDYFISAHRNNNHFMSIVIFWSGRIMKLLDLFNCYHFLDNQLSLQKGSTFN